MEPIPYFYDTIDRNAIVVKGRQPYIDWANTVFDDDVKIEEAKHENNIYLLHEKDSIEEVIEWLKTKKNFDEIFTNELNDWCTDEKTWPQKRDYKTFIKWFDVEVSTMILDLEDDPVTKM